MVDTKRTSAPTMFPSTVLLCAISSALFSPSKAADFTVQVGQGGLTFSPDHVSGAVVGDTVTFQFQPSGHTATQGSFDTPCTALTGGFDSGTRAGSATPDAADTFQIPVNSTDPIWVHCATPGHCTSGMVFAVNAASDAQLAQYQQNAVNPGAAVSLTTSSGATSSGASGATTTTGGGTGAATTTGTAAGGGGAGAATTTSHTAAGFSAAQVGRGVLMMVLTGSFGALLM